MYTYDDQTALHIASKIGNNECVQLLYNSANPDIANYISCHMHLWFIH